MIGIESTLERESRVLLHQTVYQIVAGNPVMGNPGARGTEIGGV